MCQLLQAFPWSISTNGMKNNMPDKQYLINRLAQDLIGPLKDDELLFSYPTDVYLTGILFPPKSDIADEECDELQAEGGVGHDTNVQGKGEVSLATVKRPASAGISFVVNNSKTPVINIEVRGAIYRQEEESAKLVEENGVGIRKVPWRRKAFNTSISTIALDLGSKDYPPSVTGIEGLGLHIRTSIWDTRLLVTVAMINQHKVPEVYERTSYEEISFFQTELEVTTALGTQFCSKPLAGSAIDEDTRMAQLIYRDVKEYAVGHTCSAYWEESENHISKVFSTWLPSSKVKSMSSEGVREFRPLSEQGVLSTKWLSESSGDELVAGLRKLPNLYFEWYTAQAKQIDDLEDGLKEQAYKHINNADNVRNRIEQAINLIEKDKQVETAFRLANKAIQLQRTWAAPSEEDALVWYPFQLGFFLLTLESVADEHHEDRNVADLLWFPTGGGKTEAYLGLVAFTLFLRRMRYGEAGAGVASFMRYTLRLLTVQQFQRAAALICACDALRQHHEMPVDIQENLTSIPFSLGLWVGADTTPNKFKNAVVAMADSAAKNRPDQLKYCPRHINTLLKWHVDKSRQEVTAHCDDPKCLWHKNPLPIWTIDENIYEKKPSLVIGTIDKFAQIARNPKTTQLFGHNSIYRQPDLIIQDELHLISGPLGTLAGIYEVAIDKLCSHGTVIPKIIASTATIRQASAQIRALFNRDTCLFPPPILDARNSGFAIEDKDSPSRQYLGITTAGRSAKFALQAVAASLMQGVTSDVISDDARDDFWTMVTYFNSLRELGGALVLMQDDVSNSLIDYAARRGELPRSISEPMELTSRVSSSEIKNYLDQLATKYNEPGACDVVLASNMLSVGVDVPRLGTMIVNGQPKGVAEYIQSTSRVGRRRGGPGGLVLTIYNNAKCRDRSHFETFSSWHLALYREVEATSVTPFAPRSREKALHAILVILARHLIPELNEGVSVVGDYQDKLEEFIEYIVDRAEDIDPEEAQNVNYDLQGFLEQWIGNGSVYTQYWSDRAFNRSLMLSAEKAAEIKSRSGVYKGRAIPTPNSMRNVEPSCLYVLEEKLR
ncbi:hypothetical protein MK852_10730 [Shewanella benthica]|nr:hypothetical protein [Shewanella benthica]